MARGYFTLLQTLWRLYKQTMGYKSTHQSRPVMGPVVRCDLSTIPFWYSNNVPDQHLGNTNMLEHKKIESPDRNTLRAQRTGTGKTSNRIAQGPRKSIKSWTNWEYQSRTERSTDFSYTGIPANDDWIVS